MATMRVPGRNSSKSDINSFNVSLKQQPWYQQWHQAHGIDPQHEKLSDAQRQDLQATAARNGVDLSNTDGMNFDPSGNLNSPHGFASQPTWAKALEIGAPIAAGGYFAAPALFGAGGAAGATGAGATTGAATGGGIGAGTAATTAATAGGGGFLSKLKGMFGTPDIGKLITAGGLGLIEGSLAPKPYETHTSSVSTANPQMTSEQDARLKSVFGDVMNRAKAPVDLSGITAQSPLQGYATDPAVGNPAMLRKPGLGQQATGGTMDEMLAQLRAAGVPV